MPPSMRRPGPLQELPLSLFLPFATAKAHSTPFKNSAKRPRSPSSAQLLSPTKRRILREERLFPHPEPQKSPSRAERAASGTNVPLSPARRLDFSCLADEDKGSAVQSPGGLQGPATPQLRSAAGPSRRLAPSPELPSSSLKARSWDADDDVDAGYADASTRVAMPMPTPFMVPREMPPSPDRQCYHYPGFDTHRDTHIELPSTATRTLYESALQSDKEETKENIPLRKKMKKAISAPGNVEVHDLSDDVDVSVFSSEGGGVSHPTPSVPASPSRKTPKTPRPAGTPRASLLSPYAFTPGRTLIGKATLLDRKRTMEEELDDVGVSDEEESVDRTA